MKGKAPSDKTILDMQNYYATGVSMKEVSKKFGLCYRATCRRLKRRNKLTKTEKNKKRSCSVTNWRRRTKQKLVESKGGKCEICGYSKCMWAMVFHHTDPSVKEFSIKSQVKSFKKLEEEMKKCQLLCANCHAEIHNIMNMETKIED